MLWHSPLLFQQQYLASLGRAADWWDVSMKADPVKTLYLPWGVGIVCSALSLYVVIHFLHFIKNGLTREGATSIVFWGWLGFSALPGYASLGWNGSSLALFLIVQGNRFISALVAAVVYVELARERRPAAGAAAGAAAPATSADKPTTPRGRSRSPRTRSAKKAN